MRPQIAEHREFFDPSLMLGIHGDDKYARMALISSGTPGISSEDLERHLGTDVIERLPLEVRRAHPSLQGAEGMLVGLPARRPRD